MFVCVCRRVCRGGGGVRGIWGLQNAGPGKGRAEEGGKRAVCARMQGRVRTYDFVSRFWCAGITLMYTIEAPLMTLTGVSPYFSLTLAMKSARVVSFPAPVTSHLSQSVQVRSSINGSLAGSAGSVRIMNGSARFKNAFL